MSNWFTTRCLKPYAITSNTLFMLFIPFSESQRLNGGLYFAAASGDPPQTMAHLPSCFTCSDYKLPHIMPIIQRLARHWLIEFDLRSERYKNWQLVNNKTTRKRFSSRTHKKIDIALIILPFISHYFPIRRPKISPINLLSISPSLP